MDFKSINIAMRQNTQKYYKCVGISFRCRSDRLGERWAQYCGRRRPFIIIGQLIASFGTWMMFNVRLTFMHDGDNEVIMLMVMPAGAISDRGTPRRPARADAHRDHLGLCGAGSQPRHGQLRAHTDRACKASADEPCSQPGSMNFLIAGLGGHRCGHRPAITAWGLCDDPVVGAFRMVPTVSCSFPPPLPPPLPLPPPPPLLSSSSSCSCSDSCFSSSSSSSSCRCSSSSSFEVLACSFSILCSLACDPRFNPPVARNSPADASNRNVLIHTLQSKSGWHNLRHLQRWGWVHGRRGHGLLRP